MIHDFMLKSDSVKIMHVLPRVGDTGGAERQVTLLTKNMGCNSKIVGVYERRGLFVISLARFMWLLFKVGNTQRNSTYCLWLYPSLVGLVPLLFAGVSKNQVFVMVRCEYQARFHNCLERGLLATFFFLGRRMGISGIYNSKLGFLTHAKSGLLLCRNYVINNYVPMPSNDDLARAKKGVNGRVTILWVGSNSKRKNIDLMMRALLCLANRQVTFDFWLVGRGHSVDMLEKMSIRFKYFGEVSSDQLGRLYCDSDIVVSTSISEGNANVILEGFFFGCGIVSTNTGGVDSFANAKFVSVIRADASANALSESIESLAITMTRDGWNRDDCVKERMVEFGKYYGCEQFSKLVVP